MGKAGLRTDGTDDKLIFFLQTKYRAANTTLRPT